MRVAKKSKCITGFKAFTKELKCRDFQFKVGKTYAVKGALELCKNGFHFCLSAADVFNYYQFAPETRVCEIEALGEVQSTDDKSVTSKIKILREISRDELLRLVNQGTANAGLKNGGDGNSGDRNSGHWNSGHGNSGDRNSGDGNSGRWNSGDRNSGHWNSGYRNSGHWNSGHGNSGRWNGGDRNSGDRNSGYWNSGDRNSGIFNTDKPSVRLFNKETKLRWEDPRIQAALAHHIVLTEWVASCDMSDAEKAANPKHEVTGGYLKSLPYKEAWLNFWVNASDTARKAFTDLPHFDAKIFFEITGIDVKKKYGNSKS